MNTVALTLLSPHRGYIYTSLLFLCAVVSVFFFSPSVSAVSASCSSGQVLRLTDRGTVCEPFLAVLGATVGVKVCSAGEYLAGFDSGVGADADNGYLNCRTDRAASISGQPAVSCPSGKYLKSISNGVAGCEDVPPSTGVSLSSVGLCPINKYLAGFDSSGDKECIAFRIRGECDNSVRNRCLSGRANDGAVADTSSHYMWECQGTGGSTVKETCQKAKPASSPTYPSYPSYAPSYPSYPSYAPSYPSYPSYAPSYSTTLSCDDACGAWGNRTFVGVDGVKCVTNFTETRTCSTPNPGNCDTSRTVTGPGPYLWTTGECVCTPSTADGSTAGTRTDLNLGCRTPPTRTSACTPCRDQ